SEPGRGTTFKVYLPRIDAAPERLREPAATGTVPVGSETILLVEDQVEVRNVTRRLLAARGYQVLVAGSGDEALRLSQQHTGPLHLLLTDVVMPGRSGGEVARLLTAARPSLKVLYLSGYTDESIVHHGVLDPGVAFLQKPFTAEALARKVREVIDATE